MSCVFSRFLWPPDQRIPIFVIDPSHGFHEIPNVGSDPEVADMADVDDDVRHALMRSGSR
jgi:hypothetical protein